MGAHILIIFLNRRVVQRVESIQDLSHSHIREFPERRVKSSVISLVATIVVRTADLNNYFNYPLTFVVRVGVVASLAGIWVLNR